MKFTQLISMLPFETRRILISKFYGLLKLRPGSEPFLSGDTFRKLADKIYDETGKCRLEDIMQNDIVFVSAAFLKEFREQLDECQSPFILLTHNHDLNIDESFMTLLNNKNIIHWFAKNAMFSHEKLTPLPIGLDNKWRHNNGSLFDYKKNYKKNRPMVPRVAFAFDIGTNIPKRLPCFNSLYKSKIAVELKQPLNANLYRKVLKKYMFVASPPGSGTDCFRTWEAMYLGVVPIVENNYLNKCFQDRGAPLYLIDDWDELLAWTEEKAKAIYNKTIEAADTKILEIVYWEKAINRFKT